MHHRERFLTQALRQGYSLSVEVLPEEEE